jgi:hypothetical protein
MTGQNKVLIFIIIYPQIIVFLAPEQIYFLEEVSRTNLWNRMGIDGVGAMRFVDGYYLI